MQLIVDDRQMDIRRRTKEHTKATPYLQSGELNTIFPNLPTNLFHNILMNTSKYLYEAFSLCTDISIPNKYQLCTYAYQLQKA